MFEGYTMEKQNISINNKEKLGITYFTSLEDCKRILKEKCRLYGVENVKKKIQFLNLAWRHFRDKKEKQIV